MGMVVALVLVVELPGFGASFVYVAHWSPKAFGLSSVVTCVSAQTRLLFWLCFVLVFDLRVVDVNAELSRGIGRLVLVLVE